MSPFSNLPLQATMSVVSWYYCNLIEDAPSEDPVAIGVQPIQNAVDVKSLQVPVVKASGSLEQAALGAAVANELDVSTSFYVLLAGIADIETIPETSETVEPSSNVIEVIEPIPVEVAVKTRESSVVENVEVLDVCETSKVELLSEQVAESSPDKVIVGDAASESSVDEDVTIEPVAVEEATEEVVAEPVVVKADTAAGEEVVDSSTEGATEKVEALDGAAVEESTAPGSVAAMEPADKADTVDGDVVEEITKRIERMPSIPEEVEAVAIDSERAVEIEPLAKESDDTDKPALEDVVVAAVEESAALEEGDAPSSPEEDVQAAADEKTTEVEITEPVEEVALKPVADDESETQSEVSEVHAIEAVEPVVVAKEDNEPESEIGEVMTIDAVAAAKDAALTEAAASKFTQEKEATAFGFIPEQFRKNSYAVSAVAVVTAVVATLVARR